jgi:hypothetical protein
MDDHGPSSELHVGSMRTPRLLRRGITLILGALALCGAAPAIASAHVGWQLNALPVTGSVATTWKGNLKISDSKTVIGTAAVECETTAEGTAGVVSVGKVTAWTASKCTAVTGCEKSGAASITPVNLPWSTELATVEGKVRELAVSGGKGTPGFIIKCRAAGVGLVDECLGTISTTTTNVTGGMSAAFNTGEKLKCSLGGAGSGTLEGSQSITASEGGTLSTEEGLALGWRESGGQLTGKEPLTWGGTIGLTDANSLYKLGLKCEDAGSGAAGPGVEGEVKSLTMSNCVPSGSSNCERTGASIEAINLPWHTELATIEGALTDDLATSAGLKLKCEVAGFGTVTDECKALPGPRMKNTSSTTVTAEFEGVRFTCSLGSSGEGELEGVQTIKSSTGAELSVA